MKRLTHTFFEQDALILAPKILGKYLVRQFTPEYQIRKKITEVEVYRGIEDLACHASKGRTVRTEIMFASGGVVYVYLIYGLYWLLNIVTGCKDHPQAILIRALSDVVGPGRVGKFLKLEKNFYGEDLTKSNRLWLEDAPPIDPPEIICTPRIGIDYAKEWREKLWRFSYHQLK
mgnify:CR=1 FL=1